VTFNDLLGTAVTRLAIAGCTEAEITAITGHTLRDVRTILTLTIYIATRRWPKPPFGSSKREQNLPNGLPTADCAE
jgi:hypothetical protein